MIPSWILDVFAAIMLVVAALSAARLVAARRGGTRRAALADVDVAHLLMGVAMAGTLAAGLRTLPDGGWAAVFGVLTAWFAYRVVGDFRVSGLRALAGGHCAPHLVHAGAMVYMFAAVSAPAKGGSGGMAGMGGGASGGMGTLALPFLAFGFVLVLVGYSIWDLDQVSGPGASGHYSLAAAQVTPKPVLAGVGAAAGTAAAPEPAAEPVTGPAAGPATGPGAQPAEVAEVPPASEPADGTGVLAPWVATGGRIAMGVTMAFMLIIMI